MQKVLMVATIGVLLIVAYFVYSHPPGPCADIVNHTTPNMSLSVDAIKGKGEWVIGGEKIQDIGDDAQKVGMHLTTCCTHKGSISPEQFLACVNGAKDYEKKIVQIVSIIGEAQKAREQGDTALADKKVAEARTVTDISTGVARELGKLAGAAANPLPAPSTGNSKPWEEAKAVIKLKNGKSVIVPAKTVSTYSYCGGRGLTLDYGQSIPFENMQSFAVLDEKPTIEVVPLNGSLLTGRVDTSCGIQAVNDLGPFETKINNIERVVFDR